MNSKKTSKTTPKQNTKRYLVFVEYDGEGSIVSNYRGAFYNKEDIETTLSEEIDIKDLMHYEVSIYDMILSRWLNIKLEAKGITLNWEES